MILFLIGLIIGAIIGFFYIALTMSCSRMNAYLEGLKNANEFLKKIVLCKDCRFIIDREDGTHGCYKHFMEECELYDFCSRGERKNNE